MVREAQAPGQSKASERTTQHDYDEQQVVDTGVRLFSAPLGVVARPNLVPQTLLALQRSHGNAFVAQVIQAQRTEPATPESRQRAAGQRPEVVPALPSAIVGQVRQYMQARDYQAAIDAIVRYLAESNQLNPALLLTGRMFYDSSLEDEGEALPPGYAPNPHTNAEQARLTVVTIGPSAFRNGVSLLLSTIKHEYQHVLQFQERDDPRGALPGTGGQLSAHIEHDPLITDSRQRERWRTQQALLGELMRRQEVEAYVNEILQARMTGLHQHRDEIRKLWRQVLGEWARLSPAGQRLLNSRCVEAHRIASRAVGHRLPFTPAE